MKTAIRSGGLLGSVVVLMLASSLLVAQDTKKSEAKGKKAQNRVPANYGKLDLTDDQRTKIYAIQDVYDPKIDELMAQVDALKAKQQTELEAVLKPDQKKKLAELKAESKKKADAKSKAEHEADAKTAPPDEATKKPAPVKK